MSFQQIAKLIYYGGSFWLKILLEIQLK